MHAEAVLLIDNGETEIMKGDIFLKKRMRTDDNIHGATCKIGEYGFALFSFQAPSDQ